MYANLTNILMYSKTQLLSKFLPDIDNIIADSSQYNILILINILLAKPETSTTHGVSIINSLCNATKVTCKQRALCILLIEHSAIVKSFFQQNESIIKLSEQITV